MMRKVRRRSQFAGAWLLACTVLGCAGDDTKEVGKISLWATLDGDQLRIGLDSTFKPYVVKAPVTLDVIFKNYRPAEMLAFLSTVQRTTSHGIRFVGKDMIEVSKFLEFIGTYEPGLAP